MRQEVAIQIKTFFLLQTKFWQDTSGRAVCGNTQPRAEDKMEVPTGRGVAAAAAAAGSLATKVANKKQRRQKQANALLLILCLLQLYHWPCSCDQLQQTNQATSSNELPDEELDNSIGLHRDVGRAESQPGKPPAARARSSPTKGDVAIWRLAK